MAEPQVLGSGHGEDIAEHMQSARSGDSVANEGTHADLQSASGSLAVALGSGVEGSSRREHSVSYAMPSPELSSVPAEAASQSQPAVPEEDAEAHIGSVASVSSAQAARMVRSHENEVLLAHFHRWIVLFSIVVCIATPAMIALLVWLVVSYLETRHVECDVPLRIWVYVICFIVGFNATVNRPSTTGSCVQRVLCRWTRDAARSQPMPWRVRLYNVSCTLFVAAWNCLGLYWVIVDGTYHGGELPACRTAAPQLHRAVKAYAACNLAVTMFMYLNMFGIFHFLRMALRQGLLHTSQAAPKGSLEKSTAEANMDDELLVESPQCSICLDDFNESAPFLKTKACEHLFHRECLGNWLQVNRTCPLCRQDLGASPCGPPAMAVPPPEAPPAVSPLLDLLESPV